MVKTMKTALFYADILGFSISATEPGAGRALGQLSDVAHSYRLRIRWQNTSSVRSGTHGTDSATRSFFSRAMPQTPVSPELNFSSISPTTTPPRNSQY